MEQQTKRRMLQSILKELGFYCGLLLLILCVFFFKNTSGGAPTTICGFSMMQVLTGSMETEIPKGSLIITHHVDPNTLEVGDDITYMVNATTTITHRIIEIIEEYTDTGERAFTTQGVCNAEPDKEPVAAVNVVGKVIFHSYVLGQILSFIQQNWGFLLLFAILFTALFHTLKVALRKEAPQEVLQKETPQELEMESETGMKSEVNDRKQPENLTLQQEEERDE